MVVRRNDCAEKRPILVTEHALRIVQTMRWLGWRHPKDSNETVCIGIVPSRRTMLRKR